MMATSESMFRLQVDELLVKCRRKYERRTTRIEAVLRRVISIIDAIPDQEARTVVDAERRLKKLHGVRIPFPEPRPSKNINYLLSYSKPADINAVGDDVQHPAIWAGDPSSIDLVVTMPLSVLQAKDYLDYRYFYKRAYYLAFLACGVQTAGDSEFVVEYAYQNDNELQPVLLINPKPTSAKDNFSPSKYQIRILLAASPDLFPIAKTFPDKACIRTKNAKSFATGEFSPTPFYNASLRSECCSRSYEKLLHSASTHAEAFGDACILGKVWLQQRGFGTGLRKGGFGSFEWACMLALLLQGGGLKGKAILSKGYNSIQLLKAVLQFLTTRDLIASPLVLRAAGFNVAEVLHPVLFDGSRGINLLYKMTASSYQTLRHEASVSIRAMNAALPGSFENMFIRRVAEIMLRFDSVLTISFSESSTTSRAQDALDERTRRSQLVYDVLSKGLSDRANLVYTSFPEDNPWPTASVPRSQGRPNTMVIGLILNAEQAYRTVDYGPSSEDKAAAAQYRQFWGEKAELRRFRDGSLLETLIWTPNSIGTTMEQIVEYVIRRHCGQDTAQSLHMVGGTFQSLIPDSSLSSLWSPITSTFERLERDIRGLEGLPLQIRQISAASPHLRYASLTAGLGRGAVKESRTRRLVDVCVQFEGSARWPNDVVAVQRTKIAFLLKVGELLEQSSTEVLSTRVGLENEDVKLVNIAFLDVFYPQEVAFRLRIHHERELGLLETALRDKTTETGSREDVAFATAVFKRSFIQSPLHTQAVHTLCTRFPLLSPSMRLAKKWRDRHSLSGHVSDELIELLTIHVFVTPYPWQAPASIATAFLRTLTFISKWEWQTEPLIVDCSGSMRSEDVDKIKLRFEAWRKIDPAMNRVVMFAASNNDPDGLTWTESGPVKVIAARFIGLARAACRIATDQGFDIRAESLFASSTADYDFVLHLSTKFVDDSRGLEENKFLFKNLQGQEIEDLNSDPVGLLIDELKSLFGNNVLFFHDELGGSLVGGIWNPQTGARRWKANTGYSTTPLIEKGQENIVINKHGTLNDIARLGRDLISRIEII